MIVVAGSANIDLVARVDHQPVPGETLIATDYAVYDGGKGANQAVAAARMGSDVRFVGAAGTDEFGLRIRSALAAENIDTQGVSTVEGVSGIAMISVDTNGENAIIVVPGANATLGAIDHADALFTGAHVVLTQLETPPAFVNAALKAGRASGAETILNAAPAASLARYELAALDWLMVNAGEAAFVAGVADEPADIDAAHALAAQLVDRYQVGVIITLGADGALWRGIDASHGHVPATPCKVVDTTGAGDTFAGVFAHARSQGASVENALTMAVAAGGLSVQRAGARTGMPTQAELTAALDL